jgi:phosphatidylserine decarboxylase
VDVLMPAAANLRVKMGARVKGGSTILAKIPQPGDIDLNAVPVQGA